jgi:Amt family ammonium transporter
MNFAQAARGAVVILAGIASTAALAEPAASPTAVNGGDTAWIITASALVLFMTLPGLALFYGGLVRQKNFLSVLMHCFAITAIASILWIGVGYSLAFAPGNGFIGNISQFGLAGLADVRAATAVPESVFALFQLTFAVITPALFIGAFVERVRFGWLITFSAGWVLLVYVPVAHWLWGGGWLAQRGALDFAGGIVVHTTAGITALLTAMMVGKRQGFPQHLMLPHSPALTLAGAGMLWVGWFGFNGGSALGANAAAGNAILATHCGASAAALVWIVLERFKVGKPTTIGIATGAIAGLATVTPAAGFIGIGGALFLGALGSFVCFYAVQMIRFKLHIDDSLDVFAVHGVGGITGSLMLAILMSQSLGGVGYADGVTMASQLGNQALAVAAVALWSAAASALLGYGINLILPMRVSGEEERDGLDLSSHGERAWDMD